MAKKPSDKKAKNRPIVLQNENMLTAEEEGQIRAVVKEFHAVRDDAAAKWNQLDVRFRDIVGMVQHKDGLDFDELTECLWNEYESEEEAIAYAKKVRKRWLMEELGLEIPDDY